MTWSITMVRGKHIFYCTISGCGWKSKKVQEYSDGFLELSHHNCRKHPGVFPRWNPSIRAIESTRKGAT